MILMYLFDFWPLLYIKVVFQTKPNLIKAKWQSQKGDQHLITTSTALCSYPDGVRVGVGDVAHPSLGGAGLDGGEAEEADLQPGAGVLGQLEAQPHGAHLHHGGRAEAWDLQLGEESQWEDHRRWPDRQTDRQAATHANSNPRAINAKYVVHVNPFR